VSAKPQKQNQFDLLQRATVTVTEGFDTADLKEAEALLDELSRKCRLVGIHRDVRDHRRGWAGFLSKPTFGRQCRPLILLLQL
jgi:hypothetical protein